MKNEERTQDNRRYYLSEFSLYDGERFITFNIVYVDAVKNEINYETRIKETKTYPKIHISNLLS